MIDHRNARGLEPASDRLADPAHADDPDLAIPQRADAQGKLLRHPEAGAQIAIGLDEFAQGRDQQPHRDVGDLFGQHVRRVGDDDVVFARVIGIDVIVADAEAGDDLELRKQRQRRLVGVHGVVGDRGAADFRRPPPDSAGRGRAWFQRDAGRTDRKNRCRRSACSARRSANRSSPKKYSRQPSVFLSKRTLVPAPQHQVRG